MIFRIAIVALGIISFSTALSASTFEGKFKNADETQVSVVDFTGCRGSYFGPFFTGNGTETKWMFSTFCHWPRTRSEIWIQPPAEQVSFDGENGIEGCKRTKNQTIICP